MAPRLGPGVFRVKGKLTAIDSLALALQVSHTTSTRNVSYRYAQSVHWNGDSVSIPRTGIATARQGHVSAWLTVLGAASWAARSRSSPTSPTVRQRPNSRRSRRQRFRESAAKRTLRSRVAPCRGFPHRMRGERRSENPRRHVAELTYRTWVFARLIRAPTKAKLQDTRRTGPFLEDAMSFVKFALEPQLSPRPRSSPSPQPTAQRAPARSHGSISTRPSA